MGGLLERITLSCSLCCLHVLFLDSFQRIGKYIKGSRKHLADTWCSNGDHLTRAQSWRRISFFFFFFFSPLQISCCNIFGVLTLPWAFRMVVKAAGLCRVICWAVGADTVTKEAGGNPCWFPPEMISSWLCRSLLKGLQVHISFNTSVASTRDEGVEQVKKKKKTLLAGGLMPVWIAASSLCHLWMQPQVSLCVCAATLLWSLVKCHVWFQTSGPNADKDKNWVC